MHKPKITRRTVIIILLCAAIFAVLFSMILLSTSDTIHYPIEKLDGDWRLQGTMTLADGTHQHFRDQDAVIAKLPHGNKDDYFVISKKLPDMGNIPFPTMAFETRYAAYEVRVDGVIVSRYGMDGVGTRKFIGASWHFITLPEEYEDKYVSITVYRTENHAGRAISDVYIGAHEDLETMLLHKNFFSICCGFFLVIFGICFMFLTLLYLNRVPELLAQLVTSILSALLGVIMITNDHVGFLFFDATLAAVADYMAIYLLIPASFALEEVLKIKHVLPDKVHHALGLASGAATFLFFVLHFTNLIHLNRVLFVYYVIAVTGMVVIILDLRKNILEKTLVTVSRLTLTGVCSLMICAFLDMILIVLWRAGAPVGEGAGRNFIPFGSMIFASLQIINYLSFVSESGNRQRDYASLQNIAYADALTGLSNRARADKVFEELDRGRDDYCLVSVDVNGLKDTNDRLGHAAGDRLLKDYAGALKANFGDEALCARMGGDEFLIVMKKTSADGFGVRLRRLYSDLDEMNERDRTLFRSAAIGYAFRHECHGGDAHAVYLLADERMFENKREQHIRYHIKDRA